MDENRIKEIFFKHLDIDNPHKSVAAARKEITEEMILEAISGISIDQEKLDIILRINDALTRLGFFLPYQAVKILPDQKEFFEHIKFIYKAWQEAIEYAKKNYNSLTSREFKKYNSEDALDQGVKEIADHIKTKEEELMSSGSIIMNRIQFQLIQVYLQLLLREIFLGRKIHTKLLKEMEIALDILNYLYQNTKSETKTIQ